MPLAPARPSPITLESSPGALAAADDAAITALFAASDDRGSGLARALAAVAPDGVWQGPRGTVRLDVALPDGTTDSAVVRFDGRGASLATRVDPDVVLGIALVPLIRLITGQADGALLYLAGVLDVAGAEEFLLELGTALRAGDERRPLVDPAALDPVAVSQAIAGVGLEHLTAVMAGGFRDLVLAEVFGRFPQFLIAEKASRVRVAVAFEIGGRADRQVDRYVVRIVDGECAVIADASPDEQVDATLELDGHEFLLLVLGHLNPVRGVLSGQVKVRGQVVKALGFNAVMRIPGS